jgi:glucose uptake protein
MIGWGSWANTQKLSERDAWPFPLFYWDYAFGVLLFAATTAFTLGVAGHHGTTMENLTQAHRAPLFHAFASGILFNVANLLLVVAIDASGMSVAFPIGIGLALVIGTVASYVQAPKGNPALIACGVLLILLAMLFSTISYRRMRRNAAKGIRGPLFAVIAGCLMGSFYPQLSLSISPNFNTGFISPGTLTPYAALLIFSLGVLLSNVVINTIFMRVNRISYARYLRGTPTSVHIWGLLGGIIWMGALTCNLIASGVSGPAISYALGQGATLVAALWGVFIWREFRSAPPGTQKYVVLMLLSYAAGLTLIGAASFS